MTDSLTLRAPAKVNLRLRVLAREASGYHRLETVFCALELADTLEAARAPGAVALEVEGAEVGPAEENLVVRAARVFGEAAGVEPDVRFRLTKRIPAGAGLGGGSSDAAAALRALNALHDEPLGHDTLLELAAGLGADVPFFLCGSNHALAWGRGERLLALPALPARPALVVKPSFSIATGDAYRWLAASRRGGAGADAGARVLHHDRLAGWDDVAGAAGNDFEAVVFAEHPILEAVRDALRHAGAAPALLAGSGSAVFGVFGDEAARAAAADAVAERWPDMEVIETATASS